jgi:Alpha-glucosidases, family 31 of glycosyl hydrolases
MKTREEMVVRGEKYRISVLTERLIRLEYSKKGVFVDEKTQTIMNRDFETFRFRVEEKEDSLSIVTKYLRLIYDKKEFSGEGLKINVSGNFGTTSSVWHYGDKNESLKGTVRTLDTIDGATELGEGVVSKKLWSFIDDSKSMLLVDDDFVIREDEEAIDIYFFGYGLDYKEALRDFYKLSGATPLLPRYSLGNWWSRYYKYTDESYLELLERFKREDIPFNVAVLDMDWHITDVDSKYGTGWTGYTWNKEYFKEPEKFLKELHERGYKITLNVHPADGVRAFEDSYREFAKFMGVNIKNEDPVLFDIADKKFREGYFKYVHHKLEKQGVDFWWIDWQQGENSGKKGLDPLWLLNHLHYKDIQRDKRRGLILSRYAGVGSHRYPLGFSGDTIITWDSLNFQPYFTSTASNIGYSWWSHDIGGHMNGTRDDELFVRWVQFGVFSPIMRLHSTCNDFSGKEPWNYNDIANAIIKKYLRLRQRLIPYLYTMNLKTHKDGLPLILPIYYFEAENEKAYNYPNEYYFGEDLLVCPITEKGDELSKLSRVKAYLPKGYWVDIFTGIKYAGEREIELYRSLDDIAVFARLGSILPLDARKSGNEIDNPNELDLHVFAGADGSYSLAEDASELADFVEKEWRYTEFLGKAKENFLDYNDKKYSYEFNIEAVKNNIADSIKKRKYNIYLHGIKEYYSLEISASNKSISPLAISYDDKANALVINLDNISLEQEIKINIVSKYNYNSFEIIENKIFAMLNAAQISYDLKTVLFESIRKLEEKGVAFVMSEIYSLCDNEYVRGAIFELLGA